MMKPISVLLVAAALGGTGAATATMAQSDDAARDAVKFAKVTAGLTPGKPQTCLSNFQQRRLSAIGDKLIYKVSGRLLYVSQTNGGCERVARGDALITRSFGGRLCAGDIASTVDYPAQIPTGSCALGEFTPYTRPVR